MNRTHEVLMLLLKECTSGVPINGEYIDCPEGGIGLAREHLRTVAEYVKNFYGCTAVTIEDLSREERIEYAIHWNAKLEEGVEEPHILYNIGYVNGEFYVHTSLDVEVYVFELLMMLYNYWGRGRKRLLSAHPSHYVADLYEIMLIHKMCVLDFLQIRYEIWDYLFEVIRLLYMMCYDHNLCYYETLPVYSSKVYKGVALRRPGLETFKKSIKEFCGSLFPMLPSQQEFSDLTLEIYAGAKCGTTYIPNYKATIPQVSEHYTNILLKCKDRVIWDTSQVISSMNDVVLRIRAKQSNITFRWTEGEVLSYVPLRFEDLFVALAFQVWYKFDDRIRAQQVMRLVALHCTLDLDYDKIRKDLTKLGVSWSSLVPMSTLDIEQEYNDIKIESKIYEGQVISLPEYESTYAVLCEIEEELTEKQEDK